MAPNPSRFGIFDFRLRRNELRPAEWGSGSVCTAAILSRSCPLWVKSGHSLTSNQCPLYPQKRTLIEPVGTSALCQKRTLELSREINISRQDRSTLSRRQRVKQGLGLLKI